MSELQLHSQTYKGCAPNAGWLIPSSTLAIIRHPYQSIPLVDYTLLHFTTITSLYQMNNTCTTAEIYSVDTVVPDGSRSTIVVGENLWLGPKDGWKQGSGVTLIKADGTPERLAYDSAYKSFLALDECDLLNLLPCPAVLDAGDIRTQIVKAWKEGRTVTVPWTKSDKVLLLGEVSIEGASQ